MLSVLLSLFNSLFTFLLAYGYPAIALTVFVTSAGIPLPGVAVLLVAGALGAAGNHNLFFLFLIILICSIAGDVVDYWLGRKIGDSLLHHLHKRQLVSKRLLTRAQNWFERWSTVTVFLSRWAFTPAAPTISILAGISEYPFARFLVVDIVGEIVSAVLFLSLGYTFSASWPVIWGYITSLPLIVVGILVGCALIVLGLRKFHGK